METSVCSDAELLKASLAGQRSAFGQIVQRYQELVCGITFSATGDVASSEDLAQETFLSAWKNLKSLRRPEKLRSWLCTIARNRLRDWLRRQKTDPVSRPLPLKAAQDVAVSAGQPEARLISSEEQAIVWQAIQQIPASCREPLVLYYREHRSIAQVAAMLDLSEPAVRQRLSRGRSLLKREVEQIVESALARSRPSQVFTVSVMAALPGLASPMAVAAIATAGKGAAAAKSTGLLATIAMLLGPLVVLAGGIWATVMSIRSARSLRERRFAVRSAIFAWTVILVLSALAAATCVFQSYFCHTASVVLYVGFWTIYAILMVVFGIAYQRRRWRIQKEEVAAGLPAAGPLRSPWESRGTIYASMGGALVGGLAGMVGLSIQAEDYCSAAVIIAASLVLFIVGSQVLVRRGPRSARAVWMSIWLAMMGLSFMMVNLRFHSWIAVGQDLPMASVRQRVPLWVPNATMAVITVAVGVLFWYSLNPARLADRYAQGNRKVD